MHRPAPGEEFGLRAVRVCGHERRAADHEVLLALDRELQRSGDVLRRVVERQARGGGSVPGDRTRRDDRARDSGERQRARRQRPEHDRAAPPRADAGGCPPAHGREERRRFPYVCHRHARVIARAGFPAVRPTPSGPPPPPLRARTRRTRAAPSARPASSSHSWIALDAAAPERDRHASPRRPRCRTRPSSTTEAGQSSPAPSSAATMRETPRPDVQVDERPESSATWRDVPGAEVLLGGRRLRRASAAPARRRP